MNKKRIKRKRKRRNSDLRIAAAKPKLRFTPPAWAKLLFLRDYGDTEIGAFGISHPDELLLVEDIELVRQSCSWADVAFDDDSVADFFDRQVDAGRPVETFGRLWIHTHPGDCPLPSATDEETFERVFGRADWAVMVILARGGRTYARLRFNVGPSWETTIPVTRHYRHPFGGCAPDAWEAEYLANVIPQTLPASPRWIPDQGDLAGEFFGFRNPALEER